MFPVSVADVRMGLVFVERIVRTAVLGRSSTSVGNTTDQGIQVHFLDMATYSKGRRYRDKQRWRRIEVGPALWFEAGRSKTL